MTYIYKLTVLIIIWILHLDSLKFTNVILVHCPKLILLILVEILKDPTV